MAREFARKFYHSKAWLNCRASFISKRKSIDGGLCQICKERIGYIVDHKIELTEQNINDPEISLNHDNFQFLCLECHNKKTFRKHSATDENLFFDSDGDLKKKF